MKTRIVKRYTNFAGNRFLRFEHVEAGWVTDVCVRRGRYGEGGGLTTGMARAEAVEHFEKLERHWRNRKRDG